MLWDGLDGSGSEYEPVALYGSAVMNLLSYEARGGDLVTIWAAIFTSFQEGKKKFVGSVRFKGTFTEEAFDKWHWFYRSVSVI
jgi:hypothetical protein